MTRSSIFSSETYRGLAWRVPRGAAAALALLLCAEAGVRALRAAGVPAVREATGVQYATSDRGWDRADGIAWLNPPHATLRLVNPFRGVDVTLRTNNLGFPDGDFGPRVPGVLRIAALGDSETASVQVPPAANWTSVLERRLAETIGRPVEVMNFGADATGTGEHLLLLDRFVLDHDPDVVLLNFTPSDVGESGVHPHPTERYRGAVIAYRTEADRERARRRIDAFHSPVRITALRVSMLIRAANALLGRQNALSLLWHSEVAASEPRAAIARTLELIRDFEGRLAARGIPLAIVFYLPAESDARFEAFRAAYRPGPGVTVIDATAWSAAKNRDPSLRFRNDAHLNERGSAAYGAWLAARLIPVVSGVR